MTRPGVGFISKCVFVLIVFVGGLCLGIWIGDPYRTPREYLLRYSREYPRLSDEKQAEFRHRVRLFINEEIPELERLDEEIVQLEREMEEDGPMVRDNRENIDWAGLREYWQNWLDEENARLEGVRQSESSD